MFEILIILASLFMLFRASTSNITAGENQDFSKSVDEKVEGVQPPILEDGVNAKGIGGDKMAQLGNIAAKMVEAGKGLAYSDFKQAAWLAIDKAGEAATL